MIHVINLQRIQGFTTDWKISYHKIMLKKKSPYLIILLLILVILFIILYFFLLFKGSTKRGPCGFRCGFAIYEKAESLVNKIRYNYCLIKCVFIEPTPKYLPPVIPAP